MLGSRPDKKLSWRTGRARRARASEASVVGSATSIRAGGVESADMSLSDRERVEGFHHTSTTAVTTITAVVEPAQTDPTVTSTLQT